ncbi:MAG: hypothetical protein LBR08_08255 [Bacteroidales bacterium]|nr:hypothetical protein [Bacteroidales bacterium]
MQKAIFQKTARTVIIVLLLMCCFYCLREAGIHPLWAYIAILFLRGFIRFVFRLTVTLVSIAITLFLFVALLTCL